MAVIRWSSVAGLVILTRVAIAAALAEPPPGDLEKIRLAAPQDAPAKPNNRRKVLVFSGADGFVHDSIPWGEAALRIMGEKTGVTQPRSVTIRRSLTVNGSSSSTRWS